ncbi:MAG: diguanylate cyclase (GGDEF) domain-containing protein [Gammaproteobacteria bacterium]|nr:MAG: diguanylate cyclase (GGDEF) domain-containing protein [Gammaproteobacteria bacterium]TND05487.1 MAG: diguanylate cyclase (GGDEF) domain-containing protein [Gammaproteobacteria bacterium]
MTRDPLAENRVLRHRLEELMTQARHNERKMRRFQAQELKLIGLNSLFELIETILYPDRSAFDWDLVTLWLLDTEYEIRRALEEEGVDLKAHPSLMFARDRDDLDSLYPISLFPTLGAYKGKIHEALFPKSLGTPGSVALLPLVRHGKLFGSLNVGSFYSERFVRGFRTDFLEHLAAVVSICLENAVNLERIKRLGLTDTLTAINNRRYFDQRLTEEVGHSMRNAQPLSCLLLDIDHFKNVNDSYGHQTGDEVLREVAALSRAQLRSSDVLSRYGGEEFAALLVHTNTEKALEVAERVRETIEGYRFCGPGGAGFRVTLSIGTATFDPGSDRAGLGIRGEHLLGYADKALYEAKAGGRNCVVCAGNISVAAEECM